MDVSDKTLFRDLECVVLPVLDQALLHNNQIIKDLPHGKPFEHIMMEIAHLSLRDSACDRLGGGYLKWHVQ